MFDMHLYDIVLYVISMYFPLDEDVFVMWTCLIQLLLDEDSDVRCTASQVVSHLKAYLPTPLQG